MELKKTPSNPTFPGIVDTQTQKITRAIDTEHTNTHFKCNHFDFDTFMSHSLSDPSQIHSIHEYSTGKSRIAPDFCDKKQFIIFRNEIRKKLLYLKCCKLCRDVKLHFCFITKKKGLVVRLKFIVVFSRQFFSSSSCNWFCRHVILSILHQVMQFTILLIIHPLRNRETDNEEMRERERKKEKEKKKITLKYLRLHNSYLTSARRFHCDS